MKRIRDKNKKKTIAVLFGQTLGLTFFASQSVAAPLSTAEIYRQARLQNTVFFDQISRYQHAIDITDQNGNTAYCRAVTQRDIPAQRLLLQYGADPQPSCITRQNISQKEVQKESSVWDPTYLWIGVGGVAVVATAVGLSGGGGGGGSSSANSDSNKVIVPDDPSPEEPSEPDDPKEEEPDPMPTPEDPGTDDPGTDDPDTDEPDTGNSQSGSDQNNQNSGNDSYNPTTTVRTLTANYFETTEYKKGNFLSTIKAAEAYTYMYNLDSDGNLVSHQAGSSDPLETVNVGILDVGVYPNNEFRDKIDYTYTINRYWGKENAYIYIQNNTLYCVLKNTSSSKTTYSFYAWSNDKSNISSLPGLSQDALNLALDKYGLTLNDFTLANSEDIGYPGTADVSGTDASKVYSYLTTLSHGTHIAGIIGANKDDSGMHGVAFENARLDVISWDLQPLTIKRSIRNLINSGAQVISNSWGQTSTSEKNATHYQNLPETVKSAYEYSATYGNHDVVWVQATGNDSQSEPSIYVGLGLITFSETKEYEAPFIAVTALGSYGTLASYANQCGSTKNYCITAPGTSIMSTLAVQDGIWSMSGTSMATPVVAGSIALLRGYYPWLNTQNIAYLLLETANNTGIYADSDVYGRGLLDLEAAVTTPINGLSLSTSSTFSDLQSVSNSQIRSSGVIQTATLQNMPETITTFDALHRPFEYPTESLFETTHVSSARLKNELKSLRTIVTDRQIKSDHFGFSFRSGMQTDSTGKQRLSDLEISQTTETNGLRLYYSAQSRYADPNLILQQSDNPYFAMNEAYGAEKSYRLSEFSAFGFQFQTGQNGLYERDRERDTYDFDHRSYAFNMDYTYRFNKRIQLSALGGMLAEDDALLGLNGSGAFQMDDTQTYYSGLKLTLQTSDKTTLKTVWYRGYTGAGQTPLWSTTSLTTESFSLAGDYRPDQNTTFGFSVASPLSVIKGDLKFRYAIGRDSYSDTIYYDEIRTSLKPTAREYDLSLYAQKNLPDHFELTAKATVRLNADSEQSLTDYIGLFGLTYHF